MGGFFVRQLTAYAEYHRDERNCVTHLFGIPILFLASILPLGLWPVAAFGCQLSLATVLVLPALIAWMLLDLGIGSAIVVLAMPFLLAAQVFAVHVSALAVWLTAAALFVLGWTLQIVGHAVFESRRPALLDNPVHMLIGPMFLVAKLFVGLGLRPDLAAAMQNRSSQTPRDPAIAASHGAADFSSNS
jgi:uncharacterized membrane protein YGL010W